MHVLQQPQAPINMHMNMDMAPVTNELEKLRNYISQLVERDEQKIENSNDKLQTDLINQRD